MFGLFKREMAPEGPVEFKVEIAFGAPAQEIYSLIDWSDARNAKRALGHRVETIDADQGFYCLRLTEMPENEFELAVIEANHGQSYAYICEIVPPVGKLVSTREHYEIAPVDAGSSRVTLTVVAQFVEGMTLKTFKKELGMMARASQGSLAKLKIHAEHGIEAARAVEHVYV